MSDKIVDLGGGAAVLARDISRIYRILDIDDTGAWAVVTYATVKCGVVLTNGDLVPAYVSAVTVRQRWQQALDGEVSAGGGAR